MCLLALALTSFDDNVRRAATNIGGGALFVPTMRLLVRPLLNWLSAWLFDKGSLTDTGLVVAPSTMALGAWFTDLIGLHALFGAFVAGEVTPRSIARDPIARIPPLTMTLASMLPLFFTYSGLNTRIGLLNTPLLWLIRGAVVLAAIGGNGVACWLAARATTARNREASASAS